MGFLGPVPAAQVTAMYFVEKRQLHLQAACTVPCVTTGIKFERLGFSGGLKLVLEGWSGPLTGRTEHYDVECSFDIQLPNRATPSGTVIVETANHPNGIEVPIRFDGLIIPPTTTPDSAPAAPTKSDVPVIAKKPVIPAPPNYHESFTIKQLARVADSGYVKLKFDDQFLIMLSAAIVGSDIVWTFNFLQMGFTQVIVEFNNSAGTLHQTKCYNIHVFLPGPGEKTGAGAAQVAAADIQTNGAEKPVS